MNEKFEHALIIGTMYAAEITIKLGEAFKTAFDFNNPDIREGLQSELDRTAFDSPNKRSTTNHDVRL